MDGPAPGKLRGRPFILPGDPHGQEGVVPTGSGSRKLKYIAVTQDLALKWLFNGDQTRFKKYIESTFRKGKDYLDKYQAFKAAWPLEATDENTFLSAFVGYLLEGQGTGNPVLPSSVANYLWHLGKAEAYFNGRELENTPHFRQLLSGLLAQKTPTTKALPLRFEQVTQIIRNKPIPLGPLALMVALWLSAQRPTNLLLLRVKDTQVDKGNMYVWLGRGMKNQTAVEKLMTPVHIWVTSDLTGIIISHLQTKAKSETLFTNADLRVLRNYLRTLDPSPMLHDIEFVRTKGHYTPYSVKRGALQHLAAWGNDPAAIVCLSRHKRMSTLAIYIGSFMSKETEMTRGLTRMLTLPPPVTPRETLTHASPQPPTPTPVPAPALDPGPNLLSPGSPPPRLTALPVNDGQQRAMHNRQRKRQAQTARPSHMRASTENEPIASRTRNKKRSLRL